MEAEIERGRDVLTHGGQFDVVVFDTETAGLIQPAVVQLCYVHVPADATKPIEWRETLLRLPPGVRMSSSATAIHGIRAQDCEASGDDPMRVLGDFVALCSDVVRRDGRVVAHNSSFDARAVAWTLNRLGVKDASASRINGLFCTMRASKVHSPLRTPTGRAKAFKLAELYEHLFGSPPSWAKLHTARDDTLVLALCYLEGGRLQWW